MINKSFVMPTHFYIFATPFFIFTAPTPSFIIIDFLFLSSIFSLSLCIFLHLSISLSLSLSLSLSFFISPFLSLSHSLSFSLSLSLSLSLYLSLTHTNIIPVNLQESREGIDILLDALPSMFSASKVAGCTYMPLEKL